MQPFQAWNTEMYLSDVPKEAFSHHMATWIAPVTGNNSLPGHPRNAVCTGKVILTMIIDQGAA